MFFRKAALHYVQSSFISVSCVQSLVEHYILSASIYWIVRRNMSPHGFLFCKVNYFFAQTNIITCFFTQKQRILASKQKSATKQTKYIVTLSTRQQSYHTKSAIVCHFGSPCHTINIGTVIVILQTAGHQKADVLLQKRQNIKTRKYKHKK